MDKLKLIEKAWQVNLDKIYEGFLYSNEVRYAETRNKAKSKFYIWNYYLDKDEECTYLTLPVIRCKEADKYEFEGKALTKWEIEEELRERERLKELNSFLTDEKITHCYIVKGNYYKPGSYGYTDFKHRAGVYTIEEGVSHAKGCRDIWLEVIDIKEHNEMILKEIKDLKTRIL